MTEIFRAGVRLRRVGRHLKQWREDAGMKGAEVAAKLKWSPSKISKMEHAAQGIQPVDVLALGLVYGVDPAVRDKLFDDAQRAAEDGWWHEYTEDELVAVTRDYVELESEATLLQTFKSDLVPGLLQTPDYSAAIARAARPKVDEDTVQRRIEVRTTRQALLEGDSPLRVEAVLGEATLRTVIGTPEAMRGQLRRLIEFAELSNITIQVIPFDSGAHTAINSPFDLLGFAEDHYDDVAYLENLRYGLLLEDPATVQTYKLNFTSLQEVAFDPDESIAMIAKVAKTIRR